MNLSFGKLFAICLALVSVYQFGFTGTITVAIIGVFVLFAFNNIFLQLGVIGIFIAAVGIPALLLSLTITGVIWGVNNFLLSNNKQSDLSLIEEAEYTEVL